MMLSSAFDMDIIHATSGAVYYTIFCSQKVVYIYTQSTHIEVRGHTLTCSCMCQYRLTLPMCLLLPFPPSLFPPSLPPSRRATCHWLTHSSLTKQTHKTRPDWLRRFPASLLPPSLWTARELQNSLSERI